MVMLRFDLNLLSLIIAIIELYFRHQERYKSQDFQESGYQKSPNVTSHLSRQPAFSAVVKDLEQLCRLAGNYRLACQVRAVVLVKADGAILLCDVA